MKVSATEAVAVATEEQNPLATGAIVAAVVVPTFGMGKGEV